MNTSRKITENLFWVGTNDRNLNRFEHIMPIPDGVSYNSYLLLDEKTVLFDTMDASFIDIFLENIEATLNGRNLDYTIIQHVEPDHVAALPLLLQLHPETTLVCTDKALQIIGQFFPTLDFSKNTKAIITVKDGDTLETGKHHFTFITAPMVHWPEVIVTYESTEKILFSADAFGTFGALHGPLFADQYDFELQYLDEARRYYSNIVGKYGLHVQNLLKKAESADIRMICSLHGPIWRQNLSYILDKYQKWSSYTAEREGVLIVYATMYGHTESVVNLVAGKIADSGVTDISLCNLSKTDYSYAISEAFKYKNIILAAPTYNAGLNPLMENFLNELKNHNLQNRNFAIIENGSWAPTSGKIMLNILEQTKNNSISGKILTVKSALRDEQQADVDEFVHSIINH